VPGRPRRAASGTARAGQPYAAPVEGEHGLPAGGLAEWVADLRAALRGEKAADVPCGSCTACCTSSQFVAIGPDEVDTLAHVPAELLFPAPGSPDGDVVLGYDERGHCPMLHDGACSIYEHRPRTCRTYDCRVFAAAAVEPDPGRPRIATQAVRWRFEVTTDGDRETAAAVRSAATFLREHPDVLPRGGPASLAVLAVEIADVFSAADPDPEAVRAEVRRRTASSAAG
jgi:hypothetical protein